MMQSEFPINEIACANMNRFTDMLWAFREVFGKVSNDNAIVNCIDKIWDEQKEQWQVCGDQFKKWCEKYWKEDRRPDFDAYRRATYNAKDSLLVRIGDDRVLDPIIDALPHLRLDANEKLDFILFGDPMGAYGEFKLRKDEELLPLKVATDGTEEAAWECVLLHEASRQFFLGWHAGYGVHQIITDVRKDKEVFCEKSLRSDSVWTKLSDVGKARLMQNDFGPEVKLADKRAIVTYYTFSSFGGLFKERVEVNLSTGEVSKPNKSENVIEYHCGVIY